MHLLASLKFWHKQRIRNAYGAEGQAIYYIQRIHVVALAVLRHLLGAEYIATGPRKLAS